MPGNDQSPRLSLREWIWITSAIISALAAWVPRGLITSSSPEMAELRQQLATEQEHYSEMRYELEKLKSRIYVIERTEGFQDGDIDSQGYPPRKSHQR